MPDNKLHLSTNIFKVAPTQLIPFSYSGLLHLNQKIERWQLGKHFSLKLRSKLIGNFKLGFCPINSPQSRFANKLLLHRLLRQK